MRGARLRRVRRLREADLALQRNPTFSLFIDNFDEWTIDVIELRDARDSVVALIEHGGKIKGTDTPIRQPMGVVYSDFRHGKIARFRAFQTWREALDAAGLSE